MQGNTNIPQGVRSDGGQMGVRCRGTSTSHRGSQGVRWGSDAGEHQHPTGGHRGSDGSGFECAQRRKGVGSVGY
eukprot:313977-Prorocentrum_minimum.AAC.2